MSGTLEAFYSLILRVGGRVLDAGSLRVPVGSRTVIGTQHRVKEQLLIAAGTTKRIWEHTATTPRFDTVTVRIMNGTELGLEDDDVNSFGTLYWGVDAPESSSDDTASGDAPRWRNKSMSCNCLPEVFSTKDGGLVEPLIANEIAGALTGYPTIASSATALDARIYAIAIQNPDPDLPMYVEVNFIN